MDLNVNHLNRLDEDSRETALQEFGLLIFILPVSIFTPGFFFTNILAYFKYLNTSQLWGSSIIFSLLFLFLLRSLSKDWTSTYIKYLISSGISAFGFLLIFLFCFKSNFIIREVHRLFKNDTGLELISNANIPNKDHLDVFAPYFKEYEKLPPSEREIWLKGMQSYVSYKYNDEGKVDLFENLEWYFHRKDDEFKREERLLKERQSEGENVDIRTFYNQRKKILDERELLIRKANKYFSDKTVFTNYDELFKFYCCFP